MTLKAGEVTPARVEYQAQEVAYLVIHHTISLKDAWLYRKDASGRETTIHERANGMNCNLLWGTLWTLTFGTISLFWLPTNGSTLIYAEAVPLNSGVITFTCGGGGGCFAFREVNTPFVVDTARLRAGRAYMFDLETKCSTRGNASKVRMKHPKLWIKHVREGVHHPWNYEIRLQQAWRFEAGRMVTEVALYNPDTFNEFITDNFLFLRDGDVVPKPLNLPMLDRGWDTTRTQSGNRELVGLRNPLTYSICTNGADGECWEYRVYTRIAARSPRPGELERLQRPAVPGSAG